MTADSTRADSARMSSPTQHISMFGYGRVRTLNTYLSPLNYSGGQLLFVHETWRRSRRPRLFVQTIWQSSLSAASNEAGKMNLMGGEMSFDSGLLYAWRLPSVHGLRMLAGGLAGADIGFLYHSRNGNNPAQALASMRLSASVAASYEFRLCKRLLSVCYQADAPILGAMFSPQYGQSYYEIFELGHGDQNIRLTYPGNAPSMRHQLSLDFPVGHATLRAAYLCDMRQSSVNGIRHHSYTHAFMIGWVRRLMRLRSE